MEDRLARMEEVMVKGFTVEVSEPKDIGGFLAHTAGCL